MNKNRILKGIVFLCVLAMLAYGTGRLYFWLTGGFTVSNITSNLVFDERWQTTPLSPEQQKLVDGVLSQKFYYLGKGCQSYVFMSEDKEYVLKFIKYQRFRTQKWMGLFAFIPNVEQYKNERLEAKKHKLENLFQGWVIAYENLQPETGVIYTHLNKSQGLNRKIVIFDKMGFRHELEADQMEFMIQRSAVMLDVTIQKLMKEGKVLEAKGLINRLIQIIIAEYVRGFGDNDHALMQNTGVINDQPIHIDVGQFAQGDEYKDPAIYKQALFSKTYKFRIWLKKEFPELAQYLETELIQIIGPEFYTMKPQLKSMVCSE